MQRESAKFEFTILEQKPLYQGFYRMDHYRVQHQCFEKPPIEISRELMDRPDAVCVLLVDFQREETVLIEQFRVGALNEANPWLLELVAGLIDKDESPEEVGRREAEEEAGVKVGRMQSICRYLPSPGGSNERVHLFVGEVDAQTAEGVHGLDAEGEDIRVHRISFDAAFAMLDRGEFNNAAILIALQWFQLNKGVLRQQWA